MMSSGLLVYHKVWVLSIIALRRGGTIVAESGFVIEKNDFVGVKRDFVIVESNLAQDILFGYIVIGNMSLVYIDVK